MVTNSKILHITEVEAQTVPTPKQDKNTIPLVPILIGAAILLVSIGGFFFIANAGSIFGIVPNTPTPTPAQSAASKGFAVVLSQPTVQGDGTMVVGYVQVDETGRYLRTLTQEEAALYDPLDVFSLSNTSDTNTSVAYDLSSSKQTISKATTYAGSLLYTPPMVEVAANNGKAPVFTKLDLPANTYLGDDSAGTQLYALSTPDPKCGSGMCRYYYQVYVKKPGVPSVPVGKKTMFGTVVKFYYVSGKYVVFITADEGLAQAFVVDLQAMTLNEITKSVVLVPEYFSSINTFDSKTNQLYFISAHTPTSITISRYNIVTKAIEKMATFTSDVGSSSLELYLLLSPSHQYLYYIVNDSSANTVTMTPISVATKAKYETVTVDPDTFQGSNDFYPIPGLDVSNELAPQSQPFDITGVPSSLGSYTGADVVGYLSK